MYGNSPVLEGIHRGHRLDVVGAGNTWVDASKIQRQDLHTCDRDEKCYIAGGSMIPRLPSGRLRSRGWGEQVVSCMRCDGIAGRKDV